MIPSQSSEEQRQKRQLLADYLQEKLGLSVNIEIPQEKAIVNLVEQYLP